jgi:hypothetical protein
MEISLRWQKIGKQDVDLSKRVGIDEVDVAAPFHEHLFRGKTSDLGF